MPAEPVLSIPRQSSPESPAGDLAAMRLVALPAHWPPPHDAQPRNDPAADDAGGGEPGRPADSGQAVPRQFAILLAEGLAGVRPVRQLMPWMSSRGAAQLRRLLPDFASGHRLRVLRVLITSPVPDVIEMTMVIATGPRTRALAIRLERTGNQEKTGNRAGAGERRNETARREKLTAPWLCTDIEGR